MPTVLRRLRRKLRLISYYSADRPRTRRTVALDRALVASLVLALPMAWLTNATVIRETLAQAVRGILYRTDHAASITAWLGRSDEIRLRDEQYVGSFDLGYMTAHRGWPLITQRDPQPIELTVVVRDELRLRPVVRAIGDDPYHQAIVDELRRRDEHALLEICRQDDPAPENHAGAWIANTAMWWVMLTVASSMTINVGHYGTRLFLSRRRRRRDDLSAAGCCPQCGYDLTGLEFSERCPECGALSM